MNIDLKVRNGRKLLTLLGVLAALQLPAQIFPPEFLCVTNDTLMWALPSNTCGSFNGYVIHASQDEQGPYSVLTTITDPNQTSFFHANAAGNTWYYYLTSDYNCPGQPALSSDTLDNRIPDPGPIRAVSVVNGDQVVITWSPSPSPEVFAYVISRNTLAGTTILDTIYGGITTFTDTGAAPDEGPETYFVTALDQCGNKSLVTAPHNTLFVEAGNVDPCRQSITLTWNAYQNWQGGVKQYEIWIGANGAAAVLWDSVGGNTLSYVFDQADDGFEYCFYIKGVENGTGESSTSNVTCQQVQVTQPLRQLLVLNATVVASDAADIEWLWSPDNAELASAAMQRANSNAGFADLATLPFSMPLTLDNTYNDPTAQANAGRRFYRVNTQDVCGTALTSNAVATIFLSGAANDNENLNELFWTPYVNELADTITYRLVRTNVGGTQTIATLDINTLAFSDAVEAAKPDQLESCYYVEAIAPLNLPDGTTRTVTSRSNTVCLEQAIRMYIPNAFAPEGINRFFKPILPYGEPESYQMLIFDRWGGQVFESRSIGQGWDGKKNDRPLPQGVYLYYIKLEQSGGRVIEKKGSVALLR